MQGGRNRSAALRSTKYLRFTFMQKSHRIIECMKWLQQSPWWSPKQDWTSSSPHTWMKAVIKPVMKRLKEEMEVATLISMEKTGDFLFKTFWQSTLVEHIIQSLRKYDIYIYISFLLLESNEWDDRILFINKIHVLDPINFSTYICCATVLFRGPGTKCHVAVVLHLLLQTKQKSHRETKLD